MEALIGAVAGLDLHNKVIRVCVIRTEGRSVRKELTTFGTTNKELGRLREYLLNEGVTHVAMEATGELWKPVYEVLEDSFVLTVANAQHIKHVPGRKTDTNDATWIAELQRYGLLRPSFVPPRWVRQVRDLTRSRRKAIQTQGRVRNRSRKILEIAGIKLGAVVSDLFGATGRAILDQLAQNHTGPAELVELAKGTLKNKKAALAEALEGTFTAHHAMLLSEQLRIHDALDAGIAEFELQLELLAPAMAPSIKRLDGIPGINRAAALEILAETGTDMSPWKTVKQFAAWAGLCPGNHESAGKRRNVRVRQGNPFLKSILVQCAAAAVKANGTYYQAKFKRLCTRRGFKRAIVAIAHTMLRTIYFMLRESRDYHELGEQLLLQKDRQKTSKRLVTALNKLGYEVTIAPSASSPTLNR